MSVLRSVELSYPVMGRSVVEKPIHGKGKLLQPGTQTKFS